MEKENENLKKQLQEIQKKSADREQEFEALEKEHKSLEKEFEALQKDYKALQEKASIREQEFEALQREQKLLKQESAVLPQNIYSDEFWVDVQEKLKNDTFSVKLLIKDKTIMMNDVDQYGRTLLILAALFGNYEIAELCINLGADINAESNGGHTALKYAVSNSFHDIEQLLLFNSINANIGDRIKNTSYDINKQQGIIENIIAELSLIGDQSKELFAKILMETMINTINKKLVFSDILLNLCWNLEEMAGNPLSSELWQSINKICLQIIGRNNKRDWFWFKNCMITSNIWYKEINEINEMEENKYLYYKLLDLIKHESEIQLNKLQQSLESDASKDKNAWNKLIKWDVSINKLTKLKEISGLPTNPRIPRQDNIPNGIIAEYTKNKLNHYATNNTFDGSKFYDLHQYLSKLSLLAQIVDDEFQKSVQNIFNINNYTNIGKIGGGHYDDNDDDKYDDDDGDNGDIDMIYKRGPVKLLDRARAKTENDYFNAPYPTSASILDLNRCSLVFNDINSLLFALELFINKVHSNKSGSIIGIIRCKNGFKEYTKKIQYADIKLNVLIHGTSNNLIGEIQFLLQTMVNYKHKAHNLYAIEREEEYITNCVSAILPSLLDQDKQLKIFAVTGNVKGLCQLMIFNNKTQKDIIIVDKEENKSILIPICKGGKKNAFRFITSLMNEEEIINHLFEEENELTPIENATLNNHTSIFEESLKIDIVKNRYKESIKWLYRLIWCLFTGIKNTETIDFTLKTMELSNDKMVEIINYKYPDKSSRYFEEEIMIEIVISNKLNILKKLSSIIGETRFTESVFAVDYENKNALEAAIWINKLDHIKYLLSFKAVKNRYNDKNNDDETHKAIYRILYWLFVESKDKDIIDFVLNGLKISKETIRKLLTYNYAKPSQQFHQYAAYKYHEWDIKSDDDINQFLNTLF